METSLGRLTPSMVKRLRRGLIAAVAQELLDEARAAQHAEACEAPAQVLTQLLGELEHLHSLLTCGPCQGPQVPSAEVAALQLRMLYARYPSLTVDLEPSRLVVAAEKVFGNLGQAWGLVELLATDQRVFLAARANALVDPMPPQGPARRAVVSGLSIGGLIAVALLARSRYQVEAFEMRSHDRRNIQYGGRQALIDQLASIDPTLAQRFLERVGHHVVKGSVRTLNAERKVYSRPMPRAGDGTRVPETGESMLAQATTVLLECKEFEALLREYLATLPDVTIHDGARVLLDGPDERGNFRATHGVTGESLGVPDLVVISEGANSSTFRSLGVKSGATSPAQRYLAGYVAIDSGGLMAKHFRDLAGQNGPERILVASMANAGTGKTWICAGVAAGVTFDAEGRDSRALIDAEFQHSAALVMETTPEVVARYGVHGIVGEQGSPALFTLQQRISEKAAVGTNVIGLGDVLGNSHFSVGGGMQIAAISHGQRLKRLIFDIEVGIERKTALARYDKGALEDSMAWGHRGIADFYPYASGHDAARAYLQAIEQWRQGLVSEPLESLEQIVKSLPQVKPADVLAWPATA